MAVPSSPPRLEPLHRLVINHGSQSLWNGSTTVRESDLGAGDVVEDDDGGERSNDGD